MDGFDHESLRPTAAEQAAFAASQKKLHAVPDGATKAVDPFTAIIDDSPRAKKPSWETTIIHPNDPRAKGFNYGAGHPSDIPFPPLYHRLERVGVTLGKAAMTASKRSWELDMALRRMRLAETEGERQDALDRLESLATYPWLLELLIVDTATDNRPSSQRAHLARAHTPRTAHPIT